MNAKPDTNKALKTGFQQTNLKNFKLFKIIDIKKLIIFSSIFSINALKPISTRAVKEQSFLLFFLTLSTWKAPFYTEKCKSYVYIEVCWFMVWSRLESSIEPVGRP